MSLIAAVRRSACRLAAGPPLPPSVSVVEANKSVHDAHAHACRAFDTLFARGTPVMGGAETDLSFAQYFYGLASGSLGRTSAAKATREGISSSLRDATSDIMDGTSAVMRASASLRGDASTILRHGASAYMEGATSLLRASEAAGDHAAWHLKAASGKIGAAASFYSDAVSDILETYTQANDADLVQEINMALELAKDTKGQAQVLLENFPFKISEKYGDSYFTLTRSYESEDIEVVVFVPSQVTASYGSAGGNTLDGMKCDLSLTVTVMKGGTLTVVRCMALPAQIRVDSIYMRRTLSEEEKEEYKISFEDTQSHHSLEVLTHRYLELRGVTLLTSEFLHGLLLNRGLFENIFWLGKFKEFVKPAA
ncbi:unnamed protein product [Alopecurus aequalis]